MPSSVTSVKTIRGRTSAYSLPCFAIELVFNSAVGTGVKVNAVLPGPTRRKGIAEFMAKPARDRGKSIKELNAEFIEENRPSSLIRRLAEVEEVANMVVYVCSPQASATTGAALRVDGGVVRSII